METIKWYKLIFLSGTSIEDGSNKKIRVYAFNVILHHFTAYIGRVLCKYRKIKHRK